MSGGLHCWLGFERWKSNVSILCQKLGIWNLRNSLWRVDEFSIKDFFSKCDQIRRKLRSSSKLLMKSLMENSIFVQCRKRGGDGDGQLYRCKIVCFNNYFSRLADSLNTIPAKSSLITRFCYPAKWHISIINPSLSTIVVKIKNKVSAIYFNIKFSILIMTFFQLGPDPANIYLLEVGIKNTRKRCETWSK